MRFHRFFWGIIFILGAVFLIISHKSDILPQGITTWMILGGVLFLYILAESIRKLEFFGIFVSLGGLYWLFADYFEIYKMPIWTLIGAVVLLGIGASILFGSGLKKRYRKFYSHHGKNECDFTVKETKNIDSDDVYKRTSFGTSNVNINSKNLKKAEFSCFAGEMNICCKDANPDPEGALFKADCLMGSMKLYIPKTWRVNENIDVVLGNAKETNKDSGAQGPLVLVTGTVKMGEIEIIYTP